MNDPNNEGREMTVVMVVGENSHVIGYAFVQDLTSMPAGPFPVIEPKKEWSESASMQLTFDPDVIEKLRQVLQQDRPVYDIEKLKSDIAKIKSLGQTDDRRQLTDRIPVPKKYQRNRHRR